MKYLIIIIAVLQIKTISAQEDLLSLVDSGRSAQKELVTGAFKSSRVINNQSISFIGKKVLDVRILHRFGIIKEGISELFGLDQASMRLGFDYGLADNLTIGVGRSTLGKELDGFLKYGIIRQATGSKGAAPVSVVLVTGATLSSAKFAADAVHTKTRDRMGYYSEIIVGRKFSEAISLQIAPQYIHRNLVPSAADKNDTYALGLGGRLKLSKRVAFVADYNYILSGINRDFYKNPLSLGFDIETGGHVFQLHFSNSDGMNEKAFITNTTNSWGSGEIRFGFNLSRVFNTGKRKAMAAGTARNSDQ